MNRFQPSSDALNEEKWAQLFMLVKEVDLGTHSIDATAVFEFERLQKVTEYISSVVSSISPFVDF